MRLKPININDNISGELQFYGTREELTINSLSLSSEFFEFNAEVNILDVLSEDIEIKTFILATLPEEYSEVVANEVKTFTSSTLIEVQNEVVKFWKRKLNVSLLWLN